MRLFDFYARTLFHPHFRRPTMNTEANDIVVEAILSTERQRIGNEIRVMRAQIEKTNNASFGQVALALDVSEKQLQGWQRGTAGPTIVHWAHLRGLYAGTLRIRPGSWTLQVAPGVQGLDFDACVADQQTAIGTELRGVVARIKTRFRLSGAKNAQAIGVTERLLGYWRNGQSAPRIREHAILRCLEAGRLRVMRDTLGKVAPYLAPCTQPVAPIVHGEEDKKEDGSKPNKGDAPARGEGHV